MSKVDHMLQQRRRQGRNQFSWVDQRLHGGSHNLRERLGHTQAIPVVVPRRRGDWKPRLQGEAALCEGCCSGAPCFEDLKATGNVRRRETSDTNESPLRNWSNPENSCTNADRADESIVGQIHFATLVLYKHASMKY